jgi:hypothetical protein
MASINQPTKEIMSRSQTAAYIGIGLSTLDRLNIPKIQIRKRVLFKKEAVDKWLLSQQTKEAKA